MSPDNWQEVGDDFQTIRKKLIQNHGFELKDPNDSILFKKIGDAVLTLHVLERRRSKETFRCSGRPTLAELEMARMALENSEMVLLRIDVTCVIEQGGERFQKTYSFDKYEYPKFEQIIREAEEMERKASSGF